MRGSVVVDDVDRHGIAAGKTVKSEGHIGEGNVEEINQDWGHGDDVWLFGEHGHHCFWG